MNDIETGNKNIQLMSLLMLKTRTVFCIFNHFCSWWDWWSSFKLVGFMAWFQL